MRMKKNLLFITGLFVLLFLLGNTAIADIQTVTTVITTVPIGAVVNDHSGEDHHFIQSLLVTISEPGVVWEDGDDIVITLPTGISVADPDGDGTYTDGISLSWTNAVSTVPTVAAATANSITIDLGSGSAATTGDHFLIIFPITTLPSIQDGATLDYTTNHYDLSATANVGSAVTTTVTARSTLNLVSFDTSLDHLFGDNDTTSTEGDVYPTAGAAALTAALPDFITEVNALAVNGVINAADAFQGAVTLDNIENDEITYTLWASQQDTLKKINKQTAVALIAGYDVAGVLTQITDTEDAGNATFDVAHLAPINLKEGDWYFYVTSNWTSDWVLGKSGKLHVRHYPTFEGTLNQGAGVDFNNDGVVTVTGGGADDVTSLTLDGGGGLQKDGTFAGTTTNATNINFFHAVRDWDDDDDATVQIFRSATDGLTTSNLTTSGSSPDITVTGLAGATEITTTPAQAELPYGFYNWDILDDGGDTTAAGAYYIYMVANDGKHQTLRQLSDNAGTDFKVTVSYFPYFVFDDGVYDFSAGNTHTFNTAADQYFVINWGETIDGSGGKPGDNDVDGTMTIKLYASTDAVGASGYHDNPGSVSLSGLTDNGVLLATIIDTSDTKEANRYMWDVRNSGLAEGTYYIYAYIQSGSDEFIVPLNDEEIMDDSGTQLSMTLVHGTYFLPVTPVEGEVTYLSRSDSYELRWNAFDLEETGSGGMKVAAFIVPEGDAAPPTAGADYTTLEAMANDEFWFWLTSSDGDEPTTWANAADFADGSVTIDVGALIEDMDGNSDVPNGTYDVWFLYDNDSDGDATWDASSACIKANGQLRFDASSADVNDAYNFRLEPTRAEFQKGDTLTISVMATDGGSPDPMALEVYLNVPSSNFTLINPGSPFTNAAAVFDVVNTNTSTMTGGNYQLDYEVHASDFAAHSMANNEIASFQIIASEWASASVLENINITFSNSGDRKTRMVDANFVEFGLSVPAVAATYALAPIGKISGIVHIEGAVANEGQTVTFYVCPEGSYESISDADFLAANDDAAADASDGIPVTLGANGSYTIDAIPTGKYDILCVKDGWLMEKQTGITVQPHSTTTLNYTDLYRMLAGDAGGYDADGDGNSLTPDNRINAEDIAIYEAAYGSAEGSALWHELCDINKDDKINLTDLQWPATNKDINYGGGSGSDNTADSDYGLLYKTAGQLGSASVKMIVVSENSNQRTYGVMAENFPYLHSYEAVVNINDNDWSIVSVTNKLASSSKLFFTQKDGRSHTFVSATYGSDVSSAANPEMVYVTMVKLVSNPEEPYLTAATLINVYHEECTPTLTTDVDDAEQMPVEFVLSQNYPNPFNPTTTIHYAIPEAGQVELQVFNVLGRKVRTLVSQRMKPGNYKAVWDTKNDFGVNVSTGIYFYRINVEGKFNDTRKMLLMK